MKAACSKILVASLFLLSLKVSAEHTPEMAKRIVRAEQLLGSRDWILKKEAVVREVVGLLKANLKTSPDDSESLRIYAALLRNLSVESGSSYDKPMMAQALELLQKATASDPANQAAQIDKVLVLIFLENPEGKQLLYSASKNWDKNKMSGKQARKVMESFFDFDDQQNGDDFYGIALTKSESNEDKAAIYSVRANYFHKQKNHTQCIEEYEKAIKYDSTKPWSYGNLSCCYKDIKQYDKSIDAGKKAMALLDFPQARELLYESSMKRGHIARETKDYAKAEELYLLAAEVNPHFEPYLLLVETYLKMNELSKARAAVNSALKYPTDTTPYETIKKNARIIYTGNRLSPNF